MIAVVLWFLVIMTDNPKDSRSFYNIPVTLTNVELLENENKVYEVLDNTDKIRVTVEAPRDVIGLLQASDIVATADMSNLTAVNTIAIDIDVINDQVEVSGISSNHDVVRLSVEERAREWFRIQNNIVGDVAEGYMIAGQSLNITTIEVVGPRSVIDSIKTAATEFDVTGATSNQSAIVDIHLYDENGKLLEFSNVTKSNDQAQVTVTVLATKVVPIEITPVGTPAEGYLATGEMKCEPSTVLIAGTASALANTNRITIPEEELTITGATANVENIIRLRNYLPSGVQLADSNFNGQVTATVYIEPKAERTLTIREDNIAIVGLPEEFDWEWDENAEACRVTISGLNAVVSEVQQDTVQATINFGKWMAEEEIEKLIPGIYEVPVEFQFPEDITIEEEVFVKIMIVEVEEENNNV